MELAMLYRLISTPAYIVPLVTALAVTAARVEDGCRSSYYENGDLRVNVLGQPEVSTDDKADYRYPHGEATPN